MAPTRLELSLALTPNPRTMPLLNGQVQVEGVSYVPTRAHPSELFYRQLSFGEFDVSEMSLASLAISHDRGHNPWWALPVFTTRHFFHTNAWVRCDAGVERPEDLRGKRVGVPEYQQTAAVWARAALQHEFGVAPREIEWHMERTETLSHGAATGFRPPPGIPLHRIPANQSIGTMLLAGQLDGTLLYIGSNLVDRSRQRLEGRSEVRRLFPDPQAEGLRYFRAAGVYPANHCVVVRRSLVERHPWLPTNLFNGLREAKELAAQRLATLTEGHRQLGLLTADAVEALERDPYPYGMLANRSMLETLMGYLREQELTSRVIGLEELFAPTTLHI